MSSKIERTSLGLPPLAGAKTERESWRKEKFWSHILKGEWTSLGYLSCFKSTAATALKSFKQFSDLVIFYSEYMMGRLASQLTSSTERTNHSSSFPVWVSHFEFNRLVWQRSIQKSSYSLVGKGEGCVWLSRGQCITKGTEMSMYGVYSGQRRIRNGSG